MGKYLNNKTFDEINIGDSAQLHHTLTHRDIQLFAIMSGDVNPAHLDENYAKSDMFHKIVAHGMWSGSLISTLLGTQLPGPGTIYLSQTFKFLRPVTIGDTITAQVTVIEKKPEKHIITLACVCLNQESKEVITGMAEVIAPREKVHCLPVRLPEIDFKAPSSSSHLTVISMAKNLPPLITAVVHPVDALSLKGAIRAAKAGLIDPLFIGGEEKLKRIAIQEKIDLSKYKTIYVPHSQAAAAKAVELARNGIVEAIMKGNIHTDELMDAVLDAKSGLRTGIRMSHVALMDIPDFPRPLFITDAALNIFPSLMEKRDIVQNAINLFRLLELGVPRVAILSAEEDVTEKIPSTLDATALCKMADRLQITGGILDGPLAFDNAISPKSAKIKGIRSPVAGKADILVLPNLEAGNILLKELVFFSHATMAGIIMGARVPIILTSRASDELSRKASCALALLVAQHQQQEPA